jgi:probable HAF family extracellular repeat protein
MHVRVLVVCLRLKVTLAFMMKMKAIALAALALATASPVQALPGRAHFSVTDLGTLGGDYASARAINANGVIIGISSDADGKSQVFIYALGQMMTPGPLNGATAVAGGINSSNALAGYAPGGAPYRAFRYHNGMLTDVGDLGGGTATAYAINGSGNVVGSSRTADGRDEPFLMRSGHMIDLGTLGGRDVGQWNAALGVNDAFQVTGTSWDASGRYAAFLWQAGSMRSLGTLGGSWSEGSAINAAGHVTGIAYLPGDLEAHAFLWKDNAMQDLGALPSSDGFSWGFAINASDAVVGLSQSYRDGVYADYAFIRDGIKMKNLNVLIPADSGWVLNVAYGINDVGQVVGEGTIGGKTHAFLLTPN